MYDPTLLINSPMRSTQIRQSLNRILVICNIHDWDTWNLSDSALEVSIVGRDNETLVLG